MVKTPFAFCPHRTRNKPRLTRRINSDSALLIGFFAAIAIIIPLPAQAQIIQLEPALADYVQEALENNPDLAAWRSRVQAVNERIPQAGAWPDPTVGFSVANLPTNTFAFDQEPMTATWIKAGQRIPLGGKPSVRTEIAEHALDAVESGEEARQFAIAEQLTQTWYDWAYWQEAVRTVDANIVLLDDLIAVARRKYETGRGLQQDILRAETERTRLEDRRAALLQMTLTTGRRFATLLGRLPDDIPEPPGSLTESFTPLEREELLQRLLGDNPTLKKKTAEVKATDARLVLARRKWWPDLNLGVGYGFRQDSPQGMERPDFFTATTGITIPLYGARKQSRAVEEARAYGREAASQLRSLELNLRFALEKRLDEDMRLEQQIKLYREGVEPQAEATLAAATAEYTVGRVDFEALLMAEAALYNARLDRFARVRDRLKMRAAIAALIGDDRLFANPEN